MYLAKNLGKLMKLTLMIILAFLETMNLGLGKCLELLKVVHVKGTSHQVVHFSYVNVIKFWIVIGTFFEQSHCSPRLNRWYGPR